MGRSTPARPGARPGRMRPVRRRVGLGLALAMLVAVPAEAAPGVGDLPIVPRIDAAMKARLRAVLEHGDVLGNRSGTFAKVGDSITAGSGFLSALDCGAPTAWGRYARLGGTVAFYRSETVGHTSVPC